MGLYNKKYSDTATDATVVSSSFKLPKGMYPKDLINKLHNITGDNYSTNLISKSKETVRYSLIGAAFGAAMAMYFRKSIMGGFLFGGLSGTGLGYMVTKYKEAKALKQQQAAAAMTVTK